MNNLNYVKCTEIQYINTNSYIELPDGTYKNILFGLIKRPNKKLYKIVEKGSRYVSTMKVVLLSDDGERRVIEISPYREFDYYVKENL